MQAYSCSDLRSVIDPSLRSEYGIYRLNPEHGDLQFLFPGHGLLPSPDHKYVAYLTSANGMSGFHNILVYKAKEAQSIRVLSAWEADPGSGTSAPIMRDPQAGGKSGRLTSSAL